MNIFKNWSTDKFLLVLIACINLQCHESHGLQCYECTDCKEQDDGTLKTCDEASYQNLPDKGYQGCTYEIADDKGSRKKGCRWLRFDPDTPGDETMPLNSRKMRCHLSPFDDINHDCYCFTDGCNQKKLVPEKETSTPDGPGGGNNEKGDASNTKATNFVILSSSTLGIVFLHVFGRGL